MRINIFRRIKRAIIGLVSIIISDTSVKSMSMIGVLVVGASFWLKISRIEFIVVLVIIFSVITIEGINTILEKVIDLVEPRYKDIIGEIKDALAGFVLLSSIGAGIIGIIIFWPYLAEKFG